MSDEMTYGRLGRSGLLVSRIGLGTMSFGYTSDESSSCEVMDTAIEAGINLFDTADVYRDRPRSATERAAPDLPGSIGVTAYRFLMGLSDFWRRLWAVRSPNAECPLCGAGVLVAPNTMPGVGYGDSSRVPRPRQELIAACAVHGHPPFNDQTVKYYAKSDPGKQ